MERIRWTRGGLVVGLVTIAALRAAAAQEGPPPGAGAEEASPPSAGQEAGAPSAVPAAAPGVAADPQPAGEGTGAPAAAPPKKGEVEEIVVTGIRASIQAALTTKRNAESIVDAISAVDVGKFPDENIAESLQRITGVSITRGFGEGEDVSIRGMGPGQNLTLLNGQSIASSQFFLENFEFSRGFNFSLLPSELVSAVEVFKSPQARLQEGGVGGTIVLNTRKPLNEEPLVLAASLAGGYSDLSNAFDPRATLVASWKNEAKTFGVLLAGAHQERTLRRDAVEVLSYGKGDIDAGGDGVLEGTDVFYPGLIGSALFQQQRVRTSGHATVQWKPLAELGLTLNGLYSRLGGDNTNHNYLSLQFLAPLTGAGSAVRDVVIRDGTAVYLDMADTPGAEVELDSIMRQSTLQTAAVDLKTDWESGVWTLSNHTGFTRATGGRGDLLFASFIANTPYTSDLRDGVGAVRYGVDTTDPATLGSFGTFRDNISGTQQQFYTQLDFEWRLVDKIFSSVMAGAKYQNQYQNRRRMVGSLRSPAGFTSLSQIQREVTPEDFLAGVGGPGALDTYVHPDLDTLDRRLPKSAYDFVDEPTFFFRIDEDIVAAYAQANIASQIGDIGMRGNLGVRYVTTHVKSRARRVVAEQLVRFRDTNTYGEVLPSLNLAFDVAEDVVVRLATARVMSRPAFQELSPAVDRNDTLPVGLGGNPKLEPLVANQYDMSGEWYFGEGSALVLTGFYKDILSFVGLEQRQEVFDGVTYTITRPFNGRGGRTYGFEFAFQHALSWLPSPFDGFGVLMNYTLADSTSTTVDPQTGDDLPIPGQSKHSFNLIAFYEKGPFGARATYNYRTRFFEQIDRGAARYTGDFGQLDANLSYDLFDNLAVFAEGLNLTNATVFRYVGAETRPFQHLTTGRRLFAGLRGNY